MKAALLLALGACACGSPTRISVRTVDRLRVVAVAGPRASVELALSVQTNAPVDSTVTVLAYEIAFADDPPLAKGGRLPPLQVPAGGVVPVILPAELALGDLPEDLPALAARGTVPYRAVVWVEARSAVGTTQHRLEPAGQAPLAETFGAVVDGVFADDAARIVDVGPFGVEGGDLAIGVELEFPGHLPFPLHVTGTSYDISLGASRVGSGRSTEAFVVAPRTGGRGRFALRVPVAAVPGAMGKLALGERGLTIEGVVDIAPIGPIRRVPFRATTRIR